MVPVQTSGEQGVVLVHRKSDDTETIEVLPLGAQENVGLGQLPQ